MKKELKVFNTVEEIKTYFGVTDDVVNIPSNVVAYAKSGVVYFSTNNIDGTFEVITVGEETE